MASPSLYTTLSWRQCLNAWHLILRHICGFRSLKTSTLTLEPLNKQCPYFFESILPPSLAPPFLSVLNYSILSSVLKSFHPSHASSAPSLLRARWDAIRLRLRHHQGQSATGRHVAEQHRRPSVARRLAAQEEAEDAAHRTWRSGSLPINGYPLVD